MSRFCCSLSIQKVLLGLSLAIFLLLLAPVHALAHAQYARSNPPANARLPHGQPPTNVQIWFTEQIDPAFSRVEVFNKEKKRVDADDSHIVAGDPYSLQVSLQSLLPDGPYTVVFRNVSQEDGHAVTGYVSFVIGEGALATNTAELLEEAGGNGNNFNVWSILLRWWNYLALAGLLGCIPFLVFVWEPARRQVEPLVGTELELGQKRIQARTERSLFWYVMLLFWGWVALLIYQATVASSSPPWFIFSNGALSSLLFRSHFGAVWWVRLVGIGLAVLGWLSVRRANQSGQAHPNWLSWLLFLTSVLIALTTSLNSHAAANKLVWFLVPLDLLHLIGTGTWIGGLLMFVLIVPLAVGSLVPGSGDRTRLFAALIPRFSLLALSAVVALLVTGIVQAAIQLNSWEALVTSSYGQALLIKIGLFVLLVCLGAYNLLSVSPRMRRLAANEDRETGAGSLAAGQLQRDFRRLLRSEVVLALVLLLVVGGLTSLSPPLPAQGTSALVRQGTLGDMTYTLAINPGRVGSNTFEMNLKDSSGKPVSKADAVIVRLVMLDMEMGVQDVELQPVVGRDGSYSATESVLSMAGNWQVTLVVRRPGFADSKTSFQYRIQ